MNSTIRRKEQEAGDLAAAIMERPEKPGKKPKTAAKRKPLNIAIVGTAPSSAKLAPFDDPSWQIWGLSTAPQQMPRWDTWAELHDLKRKRGLHPEYYSYLCQVPADGSRRVWLHKSDPNIPAGKPFPRERILERFGPLFTNSPRDFAYITNTISWLMAQAALEIEQNGMLGSVGLWGVDMAVGGVVDRQRSEYSYQRPSCEWFIGYLTAFLGKPVILPAQSDLCTCRQMYGFDTDTNPMYYQVHARRAELQQKRGQVALELRTAGQTVERIRGAVVELDQWLQRLGTEAGQPLRARHEELTQELQQAQHQFEHLKQGVAGIDGALANLDWVEQGFPTGPLV
jgi:hypothetical protein